MRSSLRRKILAPTLLLVAMGLVTTLVVTYLSARQAALQSSSQRLQRETKLAARLIDNWLQARMVDLHLWAQDENLVALVSAQAHVQDRVKKAERFLATQHSGHPFLEGIFIADAQGSIEAFSTMAAQPLAKIRLSDRRYFHETLQGNQVVSQLVQSKLSGNQVFVITAPLKIGQEIKGVIGAVIDFSAFTGLFFHELHDLNNRFALIADAKGVILTSSPQQSQFLPAAFSQTLVDNQSFEGRQTFANSDYLIFSQPLRYVDWVFVLTQPLDVVLSPLNKAGQFSTLLAVLLLSLISLVIFSLFHRLLNQRLQTMLHIIDLVKRGDLRSRIPQPTVKEDELSTLADAFNQMIEHLEGNIGLLNQEIQMRKDSEKMLSYHQGNLETIIAERSLALENEILERQQMEASLARKEKLEMIGALAGGVAHDLNNILSGIVTYPDLLLLKLGPASPLAQPLLSIKRSGERAAAIIQDLLTLSGHRGIERRSIDINDFIQKFLHNKEFHQFQNNFPKIRVEFDSQDDLPPMQGVPHSLAKVLLHLVGHAAMMIGPDKEGLVRLTTRQRVLTTPLQAYEPIESGTYCVLGMSYSGPAPVSEHLARIFEPFYTKKTLGLQGTGLEMAVIWGTVKEHQGFVDYSCDSQTQSSLNLYFPLKTAQFSPTTSTKE